MRTPALCLIILCSEFAASKRPNSNVSIIIIFI